MEQSNGFFGSLFDLSFSKFITVGIIKFLFVLAIIGSGIGAFVMLINGFRQGGIAILFGIILAPIVFFLCVLAARVYLELIMVAFRIAENMSELVAQGKAKGTTGS